MNWTVRRAARGDALDLARLMQAVYEDFGEEAPPLEACRDFFAGHLEGDGSLDVLLAHSDGRPVGMLTLAFAPTTQDLGTFAWLDDLHVLPEVRGRGVGAALLDAAAERSRERGAHEVRLASDSDRRLVRLYERCGFRRAGTSLRRRPLRPSGPERS